MSEKNLGLIEATFVPDGPRELADQAIGAISKKMAKELDRRILSVIQDTNPEVTEDNLEEFAKERCHIVRTANQEIILHVDNEPIATWEHTIKFKTNPDGTATVTYNVQRIDGEEEL